MSREPLLTIADVMRQLSIRRRVVYALIRKGSLVAARVGKEWRIAQADVDGYLERARVSSRPVVRDVPQPGRPIHHRQLRTRGVELNVPGADFFLKPRRHGAH
jgi:excisionase family DNA binding protein